MTSQEAVLLVYVAYLADFGEGYDAESFVDFVAAALVDAGKLTLASPYDATSIVRWFREHADRLEAAIPPSEAKLPCCAPKDRTLKGIGGERCGQPAEMRHDGHPYCADCWSHLTETTRRGENLLGILLGRHKSH